MEILWKGFLIGVATSVPVGPVGVMCIQHSLSAGRWRGFSTGFGAAAADAIYATAAVFGLQCIAETVIGNQFWFRLLGGGLLCLLGIRFLVRKPCLEITHRWDAHLGACGTAFMITITNPITIGAFAMLFGISGLVHLETTAQGVLLIVSIFVGSISWWIILSGVSHIFRERINSSILSGVSHIFRERINSSNLVWLNRIPGTILVVIGALAMLSLLFVP